jgi:outer membrane protein TolC
MGRGIWIAGSLLSLTALHPLSAAPRYTIEEAIEVARAHNPDVAIAQKKVQAARAGLVEARAGYLPAVVSSGRYARRERQGSTSLRPEDYNANIRIVESLSCSSTGRSRATSSLP